MWPSGRAFQAEGTREGRCARAGLMAWGSSGKGEWRRERRRGQVSGPAALG